MENNERKEMIKNIKNIIDRLGDVVIEDVMMDVLLMHKTDKYRHISISKIKEIGRFWLNKENSELFIDTICTNGIIVINEEQEEKDMNQFAYIDYEFLSDEILIRIMDYLIQIIRI